MARLLIDDPHLVGGAIPISVEFVDVSRFCAKRENLWSTKKLEDQLHHYQLDFKFMESWQKLDGAAIEETEIL